jgi:hypothetical protein
MMQSRVGNELTKQMPRDKDAAMAALKALAEGSSSPTGVGPTAVGKLDQLGAADTLAEIAGGYFFAFLQRRQNLSISVELAVAESSLYTTQLGAGLGLVSETKTLLDLWSPGMSCGSELHQIALESGRFPTVTARRLRNIVVECFAPRYLKCQPALQLRTPQATFRGACPPPISASSCWCLPVEPIRFSEISFATFIGPDTRVAIRTDHQ